MNEQVDVLLIGATGMVGSETLRQLLDNPAVRTVRIIVRRETHINHEKLRELVTPFENLQAYHAFIQCDVLIHCLGSTMKKAGGREAFYKIDHDFPLEVARVAKANGCRKMILLSAIGADAGSAFFYNRVKGELENDCKALGFENLYILQPSMLTGNRKERRLGERIAIALSHLSDKLLKGQSMKYHSASDVLLARTINRLIVQKSGSSVEILTYSEF